ncbi:MAG: PH domain-containing protein [Candidatus Nomurabacteria bacterium]|jgi:hypothetical protein|nr:PH domain-containing protein [Candidatus Nomurabacteria bacterium]
MNRNDAAELKLRHDKSIAVYKNLDLDEDEYVIIDIQRSKIGLVYAWAIVLILAALFIAAAQVLSMMTNGATEKLLIILTGYLLVGLDLIGGLVAGSIYRNNKLTVSNKRVFARIQNAPFAYRRQTIEIEHIEDVSYVQAGIFPSIFNYGTIRLSTVGDEHTYSFTFAANPDEQYNVINRVVQAVDEGKPTQLI